MSIGDGRIAGGCNEILVKHEDIPGFMPAMTMPYAVKDAALIRDRVAGDLITATLRVEPNLAHLTAITKTGSAPIPDDENAAAVLEQAAPHGSAWQLAHAQFLRTPIGAAYQLQRL